MSDDSNNNMLLRLPAEIRNQIYGLLLHAPPPPTTPHLLGQNPPLLHPQILRASRQMHREALPVLYGANTFLAHYSLLTGLPQLRRWQRPVTSGALIALMRRFHLCVRLDCDPGFTAAAARDAFSGVEELTVEVFQSMFGGGDYAVLRLFEGVRAVKRVRVFGSVTAFPRYVQWLVGAMMSSVGAEVGEYVEEGEGEGKGKGKGIDRDVWTHDGR